MIVILRVPALSPHVPEAVDSELVTDLASVELRVPGSDEAQIILEDLPPLVLFGWKSNKIKIATEIQNTTIQENGNILVVSASLY